MSLPNLYQDFIHLSRYSRWIESENRRETWEETVKRYFDFFENKLKENNKSVYTFWKSSQRIRDCSFNFRNHAFNEIIDDIR